MHSLYLTIAIIIEVAARSAHKATEGFTRLCPGLVVMVGCGTAACCFSLPASRSVPAGMTHMTWPGPGIMLGTLGGVFLYTVIRNAAPLDGMRVSTASIVTLRSAALRHSTPVRGGRQWSCW